MGEDIAIFARIIVVRDHVGQTAGLSEGAADVAVIRRPLADPRFDTALVGVEARFAAVASDNPAGTAPIRAPGRPRPVRRRHRQPHRYDHTGPVAAGRGAGSGPHDARRR